MYNFHLSIADSVALFEKQSRPCVFPPSIPYLESYLNDVRSHGHYPSWAPSHLLLIDHLDRSGNSLYKTLVLAPDCVGCTSYERSLPICWTVKITVLL